MAGVLQAEGRGNLPLPLSLSWPSPGLRPRAPPCHSLGCPPWGAALPGAGSDSHVPHIQSPMKTNWLHTTPARYSRKKVWSAASAQLLHAPLALVASMGEAEGAELQGSFHTLPGAEQWTPALLAIFLP